MILKVEMCTLVFPGPLWHENHVELKTVKAKKESGRNFDPSSNRLKEFT